MTAATQTSGLSSTLILRKTDELQKSKSEVSRSRSFNEWMQHQS